MKKPIDIGMNRTGIDFSPMDSRDVISEAQQRSPSSMGDETVATEARKLYFHQSEPIGSVPLPATFKGIAKTMLQKFSGRKPEVFIDKLASRLAFERSGVRLYEALIAKCEAMGQEQAPIVSVDVLRVFRDEEARHFKLLGDALEKLGADPTAMTPWADLAGVNATGLLQTISDPRTTITQCLESILIAELADHDGWQMLIQLADTMGLNDMAADFRKALEEENRHLEQVRSWCSDLVVSA